MKERFGFRRRRGCEVGTQKIGRIGEESCCWVGENKEDARCDLEAITNT